LKESLQLMTNENFKLKTLIFNDYWKFHLRCALPASNRREYLIKMDADGTFRLFVEGNIE